MTRAMFRLRVRPDHLNAYLAAHAAVSRDMLEALRDAGWRNYSIFLGEDGVVIGFFEADDPEDAQRRIGATAANARWQAAMAEHFADPTTPGEAPVRMLTEIFNLDDQLASSASRKDPR